MSVGEKLSEIIDTGISAMPSCFYVDPETPYRVHPRSDVRLAVGGMGPGTEPVTRTLLTVYAGTKEVAELRLDYRTAVIVGLRLIQVARDMALRDQTAGERNDPLEPLPEYVKRLIDSLPAVPKPDTSG